MVNSSWQSHGSLSSRFPSCPFFLFFSLLFDKGSERYPESPLIGVAGPLCVIEFKSHARGRVPDDLRACVRACTPACVPHDHWGVVGELRVPDICPLGWPLSSFCSFLSRTPDGSSGHHTVTYAPTGFLGRAGCWHARVRSSQCFFFSLAAEDTRHPVSFVSTTDYSAKYRIRCSCLFLSLYLFHFLRPKADSAGVMTRRKCDR